VECQLPQTDEATLCKIVRGSLPFEPTELEFYKMCVAALELGKAVMFGNEKSVYEERIIHGAKTLGFCR
jgi:hypothetical protein